MTPQEQASRLQAIIDTAIDGIIIIDHTGTIDTVNPAAARLFGYQPDELVGQNVSTLMPNPDRDRHDTYLSNYMRTGEAKIIGVGREVVGQRKTGETFPFRLAISEVNMDGDRRLFTGIIHDLTQQKKNEEQLKRYAAELERSNRELEDFAYVSSHDLQEPLRKIRAFGSRIEEKEMENLGEKGQDYLRRMLSAATRMQRLINDLLSFSRVSTRARPFEMVDLNRILAEVLSDLEIAIQESGAQINVRALPVIQADPTQMRQLFQNLIANAIKFRRDGVNPEIAIYAEDRPGEDQSVSDAVLDSQVRIFVRDNGIGFQEKYLDRIFHIFQRLEGQRFQGSGIGLAICRRIAVRHGGNITATSEPDKGSTFVVNLARRHDPHPDVSLESLATPSHD